MEPDNQPKGQYEVVLSFREMSNFDLIYRVGEDVSHFEQTRLDNLVIQGNVKRIDVPPAAAAGEKIDDTPPATPEVPEIPEGDPAADSKPDADKEPEEKEKPESPVIPLNKDGKPMTKAQIKALEKAEKEKTNEQP